MISSERVVAVIVTYQPDLNTFLDLIRRIDQQVAGIVVVDNGSVNQQALKEAVNSTREMPSAGELFLRCLDANVGLAAAQNIGINDCRHSKATHVILFDQDSLPEPDMVQKLLEAEAWLLSKGQIIGAVGPCYVDERQNNPPPFISVKGLRLIRHSCTDQVEPIEVEYLIASGALIRMVAFDRVGLMRADFFIDYIDIEWGLRAKRAGFLSFGICAAKMNHSLGDAPINWMGKKIPSHSPLRHYFHFRNAVRLYLESDVALNWKLVDGSRLILKFVFYSLFATPRWDHFCSMLAGLRDGVLQKGGGRN